MGCDYDIVAPSVTDVCSCVKLVTSVLHNGKVSAASIQANTGISIIADSGKVGCAGCFNGTSSQLDAALVEATGVDSTCEDADLLRPFASPLLPATAVKGVPDVFDYRCVLRCGLVVCAQ